MKFIMGLLILLCTNLSAAQETRNFRHLVLLVSFTDFPYTNPNELAETNTLITQLEAYYDTVSRQAIHLDHHLIGDGSPFVFEAPLDIPSDRTCKLDLFKSLAIKKLRASYPEVTEWDRLMLLFPSKSICPQQSWVGLSDGNTTFIKIHSLPVLIHEVGHNFGLGHVHDNADPMGTAALRGFSPIQIYKKAWFGDCPLCHVEIDPTQATTVTMAPLYTPSLEYQPVITATIKASPDDPFSEMTFFSYRTNEFWPDLGLPQATTQGVRINKKGTGAPYTLRDGEYYYLADRDVTVYQHSHTKEQVKFDVIPGQVCDPSYLDSGWTHGDGRLENPFVVCNAAQMQKIGIDPTLWKSNFRLGAHLSLNNIVLEPIGSPDRPFSGHFDGGGYSITNFQVRGLFGVTQDAEIKNLILQQAHLLPGGITASLVRIARNTTLQSVASLQTAGKNADDFTGGLIGTMKNSTINGCKVDGTIEIDKPAKVLGGVVGRMENSTISNCAAKVVFLPTSPTTNQAVIGGIIGASQDSQCNHSYAQFKVTQADLEKMPFLSGIAGRLSNTVMRYVLFSGFYNSSSGPKSFYPITQKNINSTYEKVYFHTKGQHNVGESLPLSEFKNGTLLQVKFENDPNWHQEKFDLPKLVVEKKFEPVVDEEGPEFPD